MKVCLGMAFHCKFLVDHPLHILSRHPLRNFLASANVELDRNSSLLTQSRIYHLHLDLPALVVMKPHAQAFPHGWSEAVGEVNVANEMVLEQVELDDS
jgi:hypothetical protein